MKKCVTTTVLILIIINKLKWKAILEDSKILI